MFTTFGMASLHTNDLVFLCIVSDELVVVREGRGERLGGRTGYVILDGWTFAMLFDDGVDGWMDDLMVERRSSSSSSGWIKVRYLTLPRLSFIFYS